MMSDVLVISIANCVLVAFLFRVAWIVFMFRFSCVVFPCNIQGQRLRSAGEASYLEEIADGTWHRLINASHHVSILLQTKRVDTEVWAFMVMFLSCWCFFCKTTKCSDITPDPPRICILFKHPHTVFTQRDHSIWCKMHANTQYHFTEVILALNSCKIIWYKESIL